MFRYHTVFVLLCLWLPLSTLAQPLTVTVAPFDSLTILPQADAPATVLSLNDTQIPARIQAPVTKYQVRAAQLVKHDEILVTLDCHDHELGLQEARAAHAANSARLELARYQLERARSLEQESHVSEELLRTRRAEVSALRAEGQRLQAAQEKAALMVSRCEIVAPFDGVVMERLADVGELVSPGTPVLRLVELANVEISAEVVATGIEAFRQAGEYLLQYHGADLPLKLRAINPVTDPRTRTLNVRLQFADADRRAPPGASGRLLWRQTEPHLPADVLVRQGSQIGVFVVRDGRAVFVVAPDAQEGRPARIDLAADAQIIVKGRFSVNDGDAVQVQP